MNICINIHNNPRNVHKNEKSSRHLDKKWYHGVRVKRSKSRSCLHDKAFELGTRSGAETLRELLCSRAIHRHQHYFVKRSL